MARNKKQLSEMASAPMPLRIVGGRFRGHKLIYHGDPITRPMKHRVREAIFNLIGPGVKEMHAIDLFAGTGALGLEAISRGAPGATFVERHFPTADVIEKNIEHLGVTQECTVTRANAFVWIRTNPDLPTTPWLVLCSPPYDFYVDQSEQMLGLISHFVQQSPEGSSIAVEADDRFVPNQLPDAPNWDVRHYSPATIAMYRKMASTEC
jgi:16S rRNA (guanine966-N2)-methyltransferase